MTANNVVLLDRKRGLGGVCLNFVENGKCHVNGRDCILGARGAVAKNENHECELHGGFDVWVMHDGGLLVTDLGIPSEEPAQCLAFGVSESVAMTVGLEKTDQTGKPLRTSKRRCIRCGALYWMSQHNRTSGLIRYGYATFCPQCFDSIDYRDMGKRLSEQRYWCG